ncbi:sugar transferase [Micromonospora inositola]|uniref:sugar transferase n=1 Tax=Micromonospora inositola TaxID=47865 RepID=UPI0015600225|nr:sugar transferase [Micromonospora inositola]
MRPGLTGRAQLRGRNSLSWEENFAYHVRYIDTRCLRLDLRILLDYTVRTGRYNGLLEDRP